MKKEIIDQILAIVEPAAEKLIEEKSDALVDFLLAKLTDAIPGQFDNTLAAQAAPKLKEEVKKFLLASAEKISDKV